MAQLPEVIVLGPEEEAKRLWAGALGAFDAASSDLISLCEALDFGLRAVEILVIQRLQPVKSAFPATIGLLLETPVADVDAHRDAVGGKRALRFADVLDLLSEEGLECASPALHRGWEDRRFACRRSRKTAQEAVGVTLSDADREQLLLLGAYRNRIFRTPPPVRIVPGQILPGFETLKSLAGRLL